MHILALKIRNARLQLGYTQQQMAQHIGISRSLLAMAETGKRKLRKAKYDLILSLKPLIYPSEALDEYQKKLAEYVAAKRGIALFESKKALSQMEYQLKQMQKRYKILLSEWSRIQIKLQVLKNHLTEKRLKYSQNKAIKLWIKLHDCDPAAQYALSQKIYLVQHSIQFQNEYVQAE